MFKRVGIVATTLAASLPGTELEKLSFPNRPTPAVAAENSDIQIVTYQTQLSDRQTAQPHDRFESGGKARPMYEAIERDLNAGRGVVPERVTALFKQLQQEPATQISFAPRYYTRFNDVGVRVAILNYFNDSSYLMSAMERLREALTSTSPELQAAALRNVAKRADAVLSRRSEKVLQDTAGVVTASARDAEYPLASFDSDGVFRDRSLPTRFLKSPSREVRVAAIRVAQLFGTEITKLDPLDAIRASQALGEHALQAGCEVRLGGRLVESILATDAWQQQAEELHRITMPLLHLTQHVDRSYPTLLDDLATKGTLPQFIAGLGRRLHEARDRATDTVLIDRTSKVFAALNDEELQSHFQVDKLCEALGITDVSIIKAPDVGAPSSEREDFERKHNEQLNNAISQEHRQKYLAKLDSLVVKDFKGEYLKAVKRLGDDPNALAVVWNLGHGEPHHFWFQEGLPGTMSRTDLKHPSGVSYKEIAHALFFGPSQSPTGKVRGTLDLSRKLLVLSPCLQYDMALSIIAELQRLAKEHSVAVVMPHIIASNQRGMVSYANHIKLYEVPEIENPEDPTGPKILSDDSYLMTVVSSHQFMNSIMTTATDRRITVADVLREDFAESVELTNQLSDPAILEPIAQINKHDPAFFFSKGLDVEQAVRVTLDEIGEGQNTLPKSSDQPKGATEGLFHELGIIFRSRDSHDFPT